VKGGCIARFIDTTGLAIERIGLESGCTAAWLFAGLQRYGWPVIRIDARHAAAALQAGFRNKNDRNDARGIADLMRVNKYRPVRQCFDCRSHCRKCRERHLD
jgi:transposase